MQKNVKSTITLDSFHPSLTQGNPITYTKLTPSTTQHPTTPTLQNNPPPNSKSDHYITYQ